MQQASPAWPRHSLAAKAFLPRKITDFGTALKPIYAIFIHEYYKLIPHLSCIKKFQVIACGMLRFKDSQSTSATSLYHTLSSVKIIYDNHKLWWKLDSLGYIFVAYSTGLTSTTVM